MIYIFYGSDSFSRREAFEELRRLLDVDGSLETNTQRFQARETEPEVVIAACATVPFLGEHRLVVLEGLLQLAQEGAGHGKKSPVASPVASTWQPLLDFLALMPSTTELVLLDGAVTASALFTALKALATVRHFPAPEPKGLDRWVTARAQKLGIRLDVRAARLLAQMVGGQEAGRGREYLDTWSLASELNKLAAYADGDIIREQDVQALSPVLREQKAYFLCDAIVERRPAVAARLLDELLGQREPGQVILSTVAGRFRRLAIAREMMDSGESGEAIRRELEAKAGYGFDKMLEQAGRYSLDDSRKAFRRIVEADFNQKSGLGDERLELTALVQELASRN